MDLQAKEHPSPPTVWTWLAITFLWGTVFFGTSILTLRISGGALGQGFFNPSWSEIYSVYAVYFFALFFLALSAMMIRRRQDPWGEKQAQRRKDVLAGKREQVVVSFAASIVTSFSFTVLTAFVFVFSAGLVEMTVVFTVPVVFAAAVLNIVFGLSASLAAGLVILLLKKL